MHHNIKPFKMYVSNMYLYNMNETQKDFSKCKVIAVSFYKDCYPTFTILIEDKFIFSDIPSQALHKKGQLNKYKNKELYYKVNPSSENEHFILSHLISKNIFYYSKMLDEKIECEYIGSFDFYNDNELMHMLLSTSGEIIFSPNHKIIIDDDKSVFPPYEKLRKTWR